MEQIKNCLSSWINVPFKHQGYTKYGCDCLGLIIGILIELYPNNKEKIINFMNNRQYGTNLNIYLKDITKDLSQFCKQINLSDMKLGDILLFSSIRIPIHFAIKYDNQSILEANSIVGKVIQSNINIKNLLSVWRYNFK